MDIVGTQNMMEWILEKFEIINSELKIKVRCRGNYYCLDSTGNRIFKIYNNLKLLQTPILERKWIF